MSSKQGSTQNATPAHSAFFGISFSSFVLSLIFSGEDPKYSFFNLTISQWFLTTTVLFFLFFLISYGIQIAAKYKAASEKETTSS